MRQNGPQSQSRTLLHLSDSRRPDFIELELSPTPLARRPPLLVLETQAETPTRKRRHDFSPRTRRPQRQGRLMPMSTTRDRSNIRIGTLVLETEFGGTVRHRGRTGAETGESLLRGFIGKPAAVGKGPRRPNKLRLLSLQNRAAALESADSPESPPRLDVRGIANRKAHRRLPTQYGAVASRLHYNNRSSNKQGSTLAWINSETCAALLKVGGGKSSKAAGSPEDYLLRRTCDETRKFFPSPVRYSCCLKEKSIRFGKTVDLRRTVSVSSQAWTEKRATIGRTEVEAGGKRRAIIVLPSIGMQCEEG